MRPDLVDVRFHLTKQHLSVEQMVGFYHKKKLFKTYQRYLDKKNRGIFIYLKQGIAYVKTKNISTRLIRVFFSIFENHKY